MERQDNFETLKPLLEDDSGRDKHCRQCGGTLAISPKGALCTYCGMPVEPCKECGEPVSISRMTGELACQNVACLQYEVIIRAEQRQPTTPAHVPGEPEEEHFTPPPRDPAISAGDGKVGKAEAAVEVKEKKAKGRKNEAESRTP
jgi:hypothetical protein